MSRKQVPLVEWFTSGPEGPHLVANRCASCGDYFFPKASRCRNPDCMSEGLDEIRMSRKGNLWSYTVNYYQPPPPYVPAEPFAPYALAVVELRAEKMMIMGQVAADCDVEKLEIGMEMVLTVETLYSAEDTDYLIWKWRPAAS